MAVGGGGGTVVFFSSIFGVVVGVEKGENMKTHTLHIT
jgi:hypothetical protein